MVVIITSQPVSAQQPPFNVVYEVRLDQHFGIYSQTTQEVNLIVSGSPGKTNGSLVVTVSFYFIFRGINGLPNGANYTISVVSQHPLVNQIEVKFPPGTSDFEFTIIGKFYDSSILLRGAATIQYAKVSMNAPPYNPTSYQVLIPTTSRVQIVSVFPGTGPGLATQLVTIIGTSYLSTGFSYLACFTVACAVSVGANTISVIYQPEYFNYFIAAYLVFALAALAVVGLFLRERRITAGKIFESVKRAALAVFTSVDSKKLLAALVGVAILMVSLALVFGPSTSPRAYLAATPTTAQTLGPYVTGAGFTYLTPLEAGDEFDAMCGLNSFNTVILADYAPNLQSAGYLSCKNVIAVTGYVNSTLVKDLKLFRGNSVTVVNTPQQMQFDLSLQARSYSSNHLGLPISQQTWTTVTLVEGALSLLLPFLALAFFARYLIESGSKGIGRLAQAAGFSFFVFMFGELAYLQTDILLTLPVALHATISPRETAIGSLGFGGGSRPRMVMGALGFLFGAFAGSLKGTRIDKVILVSVISALVFLLADPLQLGQDFYNLLLQILSSEGGTAFGQAAYSNLRAFVSVFMNAFGNEIVPTFFSQHGAVICFAGAVPFALYTYVRRSTATLLLFYSAVVTAVGYVRIGDQDPLKAIASTTPGFAMAVLFILAFFSIDRVERFLRLRLGLG
jgi:hypothetical protein